MNKAYYYPLIFFSVIKPRGNFIPVEKISFLFGTNIPKYSNLPFLDKPNGDQHYLFCVDTNVNAHEICKKYHYKYLLLQRTQLPYDIYDKQYNKEHKVVTQYSYLDGNYYTLEKIMPCEKIVR